MSECKFCNGPCLLCADKGPWVPLNCPHGLIGVHKTPSLKLDEDRSAQLFKDNVLLRKQVEERNRAITHLRYRTHEGSSACSGCAEIERVFENITSS